MIIGFSALLAQGLAHYLPKLYWHQFFDVGTFFLRIVPPLLVILFLFSGRFLEFGWCKPKMDRWIWIFFISFLILMPIISSYVALSPSYLAYYSNSFGNTEFSGIQRLIDFTLFTLSTFTGWFFLHRSFLLFGMQRLLVKEKLEPKLSATISILIVCIFEVMFHFNKPPAEALGLLVASPVFSWLALRTKSILLPVICHLYIEILFIGYVLMKTWS